MNKYQKSNLRADIARLEELSNMRNKDIDADELQEISDELDEICDEEQEKLDNMFEHFGETFKYMEMESDMFEVENARDALDCVQPRWRLRKVKEALTYLRKVA